MTTTSVRSPWIWAYRLAGALALRSSTFEDVEADRSATAQAFATVLLSSLAAGIGARGFGHRDLGDALFISLLALMAWVAWAVLIYEIGSRILPERQTQTTIGELLRTIGLAAAPGLLNVLAAVPAGATLVFATTSLWALLAMVIAVRQALDYSNVRRAAAVCILAGGLVLIFALGIGLLVESTAS